MLAFGYDYNRDDYKLLAGVCGPDSVFEVFSQGLNSWRTIRNILSEFYISNHSGVLVNGVFHWLDRRKGSSNVLLVSLDISNEIFKEMELPKQPSEEIQQRRREWDYRLMFLNLGVVEGCLCLFVVEVAVRVDVWVLQNYGVPDSWTKRYTL
ncbi:F-box/kelch-repeat protein At3g06240-like [Papaver somniferum]|uniref:F-box/kelch-repeat protein At3g06240-like n=1 Tax=Papaver somniferum TaxID=3469 RepID=UPI000E7040F6|nr:F-box/kelch-repeat protein At3g06240-like [Papaver somniferum]